MIAVAACSVAAQDTAAIDGQGADASLSADVAPRRDGGARKSTIAVELGTGSAFFVPVTNGQELAIIRGKQGFQHIWLSARVVRPAIREAIVTISTRLQDGRPGGPPLSAAVSFDPIDGGEGQSEKVGLTALVDYVVIGKTVKLRLEVATADGLWGVDERTVAVLPPIEYRCTADAGTTTCDALCSVSRCSICESGSSDVGYVNRPDASPLAVGACSAPVDVDALQFFACCCCR